MARRKIKKKAAEPEAPGERPAPPIITWPYILIRLAIGVAAGLAIWLGLDRTEPGTIGGILAFFVSLAWVARRVAASEQTRPAAPLAVRVGFGLGALSVSLGAATLLVPSVLSREQFLNLTETINFLPLVGVSFLAVGVVVLLRALHRLPPGDPPFALEREGVSISSKLKELNPKFFFVDTWRELDREAEALRAARPAGHGYDWRPILVLGFGAVFLSLMEYWGHAPTLRDLIDHFDPVGRLGPPENVFGIIRDSPFRRLLEFAWWSGWRVLGFFLLPAAIIRFVLRERVVDHGLQTHGFLNHAWIYLLFFGIVLLLVVGVSFDPHFQTYYPFYSEASRSWYDFWAWEMLYAAQFFSLEFFFRGFWLKAAKRAMGSHAIFAMVVPYCMIHFGKPFPETLAAIVAGIVLGTLALRTRSIWSGFLIHVSVAISMDMAALAQTTGLPDRWWPAL